MIPYRVLMRERNEAIKAVKAKETSIRMRQQKTKDYTEGSMLHITDMAELTALRLTLWDADRALIDLSIAKNSVTRDTIYQDFARVSAQLKEAGRLPDRNRTPINHPYDAAYSRPDVRRKFRPVKTIRYEITKHKTLARMLRTEAALEAVPLDRAQYLEHVRAARAALHRWLAYQRCLLRRYDREETYIEKRQRENEEKLEMVRRSAYEATGQEPPAPPIVRTDPDDPESGGKTETYIQRKLRENLAKEEAAKMGQSNEQA